MGEPNASPLIIIYSHHGLIIHQYLIDDGKYHVELPACCSILPAALCSFRESLSYSTAISNRTLQARMGCMSYARTSIGT